MSWPAGIHVRPDAHFTAEELQFIPIRTSTNVEHDGGYD